MSANLNALLFEFMADQYRHAGVPFSKGKLAQVQLTKFLHEQSPSCLVPRRALLDSFLAKLFDFLGAKPYRAGCLIELFPAYLHFLARLNLIHPTEMDNALAELWSLADDLHRVIDNFGVDLLLLEAMANTWSETTLTALRNDPTLATARTAPPIVPAPLLIKPAKLPDALQTYTFQVTCRWDPDVWRKIEIAENQTLDDLHYAIQSAVKFDRDHLYSFFMSGRAWDKATEYASPYGGEGRSAA